MKIITFVLLIQFGYIIAKAVENSRSCNDSLENDPRLKQSDEIDIDSEITGKPGKILEDDNTGKQVSKLNSDTDGKLDDTDNSNEETNEFAANPDGLPQKLPLVKKVTMLPVSVEKTGTEINKLRSQDVPQEETIYYQPIDPKYLIISGLSLPRGYKNVTNTSKPEDPVTVLEEMVTTSLDNVNVTEVMNITNGDEATNRNGDEILINNVTNIRELREHLLDHLLDYFINIIKEENLLQNNTRKNNGKDRMKVEEKLSNYYDPQHLDMLLEDNDDYNDTYQNNTYYSASEEVLFDNEELDKENSSNHSLKTLAGEIINNSDEIQKSLEEFEELDLNIERNRNNSSPNEETLSANLSESITTEYINLIEKENYFSLTLSNTTVKSKDGFDSNINVITTTERSFSDDALSDEIDTVPLNYLDEVTNGADNVYDIGALITEEDTSYEDFVDSDEFQASKNINVDENNVKPTIKENGRRHSVLDIEKSIENITSENDTNAQNLDNGTANPKSKHGKGLKTKELVVLDTPNKNVYEKIPYDENKYKKSSKKLKNVTKKKLMHNKNPSDVVNKKNKKSKRHHCGDSIVINLNINLK